MVCIYPTERKTKEDTQRLRQAHIQQKNIHTQCTVRTLVVYIHGRFSCHLLLISLFFFFFSVFPSLFSLFSSAASSSSCRSRGCRLWSRERNGDVEDFVAIIGNRRNRRLIQTTAVLPVCFNRWRLINQKVHIHQLNSRLINVCGGIQWNIYEKNSRFSRTHFG